MRKIAEFNNLGRTTKVYRDADNNEYVVKLAGAPKADYHTSDKDDALATAQAMIAGTPLKGETK